MRSGKGNMEINGTCQHLKGIGNCGRSPREEIQDVIA